jgi:hypothetical protein
MPPANAHRFQALRSPIAAPKAFAEILAHTLSESR